MTNSMHSILGPADGEQFCRFWSSHVDALDRHLSTDRWVLTAVTVALIGYPIARVVVPAGLNGMVSVVPEVVRTILKLI